MAADASKSGLQARVMSFGKIVLTIRDGVEKVMGLSTALFPLVPWTWLGWLVLRCSGFEVFCSSWSHVVWNASLSVREDLFGYLAGHLVKEPAYLNYIQNPLPKMKSMCP